MVTLQVAVDSTAGVQGSQAIAREIERMGQQAAAATQRVDQLETNIGQMAKEAEASRKAFESLANENRRLQESLRNSQAALQGTADKAAQFQRAAGALNEVTQVGQRVKLLGEEVRNLGSGFSSASSVLNTFALGLTDIAQISSKAQGGFGGLVGLLRANPLLAAAGVITAIATAMSLFSNDTEKANEKLKEQISLQDELRKASQDLATQIQRNADLQRIGFNVDPQEQQLLRARRVAEVASGLAGQQGILGISELGRLTGTSPDQIRRLAVQRGLGGGAAYGGQVQIEGVGGAPVPAQAEFLPAAAAREVLLLLAQQLREQAVSLTPTSADQAPGFGNVLSYQQIAELQRRGVDQGPGFEGILNARQIAALQRQAQRPIGPQPGPDYMTPEQMAAYTKQFAPPTVLPDPEALQRGQEELERFNERLREMKSLGQEAGTAIGNAFFSIVNGAGTARQALAALLQQFIAIAQQRAVAGFANAVSNSFGAAVGKAPGQGVDPGAALEN